MAATLSIYSASRSGLVVMYLLAFVMTVIVLHFCSVHLRVEEDSVVYGFGVWMWPKRTIGYGQIQMVEVVQVEPMKYGGLVSEAHGMPSLGGARACY